jgi:serine/threonine protein kinase
MMMNNKVSRRQRTRVGKYEMGKTIGEGSFAKVKLAKNVENGNYVAMKILDRNHVLRHNMMEQVCFFFFFLMTLLIFYLFYFVIFLFLNFAAE